MYCLKLITNQSKPNHKRDFASLLNELFQLTQRLIHLRNRWGHKWLFELCCPIHQCSFDCGEIYLVLRPKSLH